MKKIESWSDVTVRQLVEIKKLDLDNTANTIGTQNKLVEILFGVKADTMPFDEYMEKVLSVSEVLGKPLVGVYKPKFEFEGCEFEAVPIESFTTREFTDFDALARENNTENFPLLLALIYRGSGDDKYNKDNYSDCIKEKAEFLENLDVVTAIGAINFFINALLHYLKDTIVSSDAAKAMMEKNPKMMESMKMLEDYLAGAGN